MTHATRGQELSRRAQEIGECSEVGDGLKGEEVKEESNVCGLGAADTEDNGQGEDGDETRK